MTGALTLLVLALIAALFVAVPLVRPPREYAEPAPTAGELRRLELAEQRDAAYSALRELEFELRTGKLIESDYERARAELRADAIAALRDLELLDAPPAPASNPG